MENEADFTHSWLSCEQVRSVAINFERIKITKYKIKIYIHLKKGLNSENFKVYIYLLIKKVNRLFIRKFK